MIDLIDGVPCHIQLIMEKSLKLFLDSSHNLKKPELKRLLSQAFIEAKIDRGQHSPFMRIKIDRELEDPCNWLLAYIHQEDFDGFSFVIDYEDKDTSTVYRFYYALCVRGNDGYYSLTHVKRKEGSKPRERLYYHGDRPNEIESRKIPFTLSTR